LIILFDYLRLRLGNFSGLRGWLWLGIFPGACLIIQKFKPMLKRRLNTKEDEQFSSPLFNSSDRLRKSNQIWNLKTFEVDKKALLNEGETLIGTIKNQIVELGKPFAPYTAISSSFEPLPLVKPENRHQFKEEQQKVPEKPKDSDKKLSRKLVDIKKNSDTYSGTRISTKDDRKSNDKLRLFDRNLVKIIEKPRKVSEYFKRSLNPDDISEYLSGDLKHLYYRVNKKSEESRKLAETTSLLSIQTKQKIELLESKVAKLKAELINPALKSVELRGMGYF
jgi:hypothetical protein